MFFLSDIFKKKKFWFSLAGLVVAVLILRNNWNLIAGGGKAAPNFPPAGESSPGDGDEAFMDSLLDGEPEGDASYGLHPPTQPPEKPGTDPADGSLEAPGQLHMGASQNFQQEEEQSKEMPGRKGQESSHKPEQKTSQPKSEKKTGKPGQKTSQPKPEKKPSSSHRNLPTPHQSYVTESFICPLQSEPMLYILLQLELVYEDPALEKEISEKRDQMTALVQNLIFTKEKSQLNADYLRREIKRALNGYLKQGNLEDIIFKNFKLEIRKSK